MTRHIRPAFFLTVLAAVSLTLWPGTADAQGRRRGGRPAVVVAGGYYSSVLWGPFYDAFFGPAWWPPYARPYPYYAAGADVRVLVAVKDAEVYVDGYYAGIVDDFDGVFQRLTVPPGGHEFVLYREGFRTVRQTVYVQPGATFSLRETMVPLAPGETMEPRPVPAPVPPATPEGGPRDQQAPGAPAQPDPQAATQAPGW